MERLVLVISSELDRVGHKPEGKKNVVGRLEGGVRLSSSLIYRKRNHE